MNSMHSLAGLRVLAVLNSPELFGHERGNIEVFKALRGQGAVVCVAVTSRQKGGAVRAEVEALGFESVSIPFGFQWSKKFFTKNPFLLLLNCWHWLRSNQAMRKAIREFNPTHIHMGNALAFSFVSWAVRRSGVPLIARLGDAPPLDSAVQMMLWRHFVSSTTTVIANSAYVWSASADAYPPLGEIPPRVIHNLAPLGRQNKTTAGYVSNYRHVLYVGQLTRDKGVFEFIHAAALLRDQYPKLHCHLVGGSKYTTDTEKELKLLVKQLHLEECVQFHGWINNAREFYAKADVHVAPSVWEEPFANVVMEAKREGTPSVVFSSGGLPEMISHQINGYVCNEKNHSALAKGITWVLDHDAEAMKKLRHVVARDCVERFGEPRFIQAWSKAYCDARI